MTSPVLHAEYERLHPDAAEYARTLEQTARNRWQATHGTLDGFKPSRAFPCPGWLRPEDQIGRLTVLCCDGCGFVITVRERAATGGDAW